MGKRAKQAPPPAEVAGPCMVRRERWLDLPDQETYPGFRFLFWTNHPNRMWNSVFAGRSEGSADDMAAALRQIVRRHNGWRDPDGAPFPEASAPEFYEVISNELAQQILLALLEWDKGPLPNSPGGTRGSSGSGSKPETRADSPSPGSTSGGE